MILPISCYSFSILRHKHKNSIALNLCFIFTPKHTIEENSGVPIGKGPFGITVTGVHWNPVKFTFEIRKNMSSVSCD